MMNDQETSDGLPSAPDLIKLYEQGNSMPELAARFGTTKQAVSVKIARYRGAGIRSYTKLLPWVVATAHQHKSTIIQAAASYVKWKRGLGPLKADELRLAQQLESVAKELKSVLIYDRERRFHWRSRRPTDDDYALAAE